MKPGLIILFTSCFTLSSYLLQIRDILRSQDPFCFLLKGTQHGAAQPFIIDRMASAAVLSLRLICLTAISLEPAASSALICLHHSMFTIRTDQYPGKYRYLPSAVYLLRTELLPLLYLSERILIDDRLMHILNPDPLLLWLPDMLLILVGDIPILILHDAPDIYFIVQYGMYSLIRPSSGSLALMGIPVVDTKDLPLIQSGDQHALPGQKPRDPCFPVSFKIELIDSAYNICRVRIRHQMVAVFGVLHISVWTGCAEILAVSHLCPKCAPNILR